MTDEKKDIDLKKIHVCVDQTIPQRMMLDAAERSIAENPENAPSGSVDANRKIGVDSKALETFGAVLTGKKWKTGRVLRVRHLGGDPDICKKVEKYAKQWEQFTNITFSFVKDGEAEIRISYVLDNRSSSYVGTDALSRPSDAHTMHYGWLTPDTTDQEVRRVVLHEFGHALGMIHEHEHPDVKIKWDEPVVYRYYMEELGWTKLMVDNNLFSHFTKEETQFDKYDPKSIMHYPVPPEFTTDHVSVGWNLDLSDTDKRFVGIVYPKAKPAEAFPPPGNAPAVEAGAAGESRLRKSWGTE